MSWRCRALHGSGVAALPPAINAVHALWNRRIDTAPLNQWLGEVEARHPPPLVRGRRIRLKYVTQAKARPPTFALFASRSGGLPDSYVRFLENDPEEALRPARRADPDHAAQGPQPLCRGLGL